MRLTRCGWESQQVRPAAGARRAGPQAGAGAACGVGVAVMLLRTCLLPMHLLILQALFMMSCWPGVCLHLWQSRASIPLHRLAVVQLKAMGIGAALVGPCHTQTMVLG